MKTIVVSIAIICHGLFMQDGEQCKKYIVTDFKDSKVIYVLASEEWEVGDSLNVNAEHWAAAKDTLTNTRESWR